MSEARRRLGVNFRVLREARGLSREAIAARTRSTATRIAAIERGEIDPTWIEIVHIAAVLEAELGPLFTGIGWNDNLMRLIVRP